jgi:hypothetical protein
LIIFKTLFSISESEETIEDVVNIYRNQELIPTNESIELSPTNVKLNNSSTDLEKQSPILVRRSNPFRKTDSDELSPSLLQRVRKRLPVKSRLRATVIDDTAIAQSKFFSTNLKIDMKNEEAMEVVESTNVHVNQEDYKENMISSFKIIIPETQVSNNELASFNLFNGLFNIWHFILFI